MRHRTGATYAYKTTPSLAPQAIDLISPSKSPTASGPAATAHSMSGEAPPDPGRTVSALSSRGSSELQNGDDGVLRCPQPVKQKSGRKKKRDEQKRLKNEDVRNDLVPVKEETPPELVTDVQPEVEQAGSNEDVEGTPKELDGDDPDLSIRAGLTVDGVSLQRDTVALNDDVPSSGHTLLSLKLEIEL